MKKRFADRSKENRAKKERETFLHEKSSRAGRFSDGRKAKKSRE
ncbi:MAG: hypothetical protein V1494_02155 [Candidatus Diapherotrites archaeon]